MYFLLLFGAAFFLISIFSANWPTKLYHHLLLKKLAQELNTQPQKRGMMFSDIYSEIISNYQGKDFKIRFIESTVDSIKANSGLEIRMSEAVGIVMEFYRVNHRKRVWGDYRQFLTGDSLIDSEWFILTTDIDKANELWRRTQLAGLLKAIPQLDQILINREEIIIRLKYYRSSKSVLSALHQLASCFSKL